MRPNLDVVFLVVHRTCHLHVVRQRLTGISEAILVLGTFFSITIGIVGQRVMHAGKCALDSVRHTYVVHRFDRGWRRARSRFAVPTLG